MKEDFYFSISDSWKVFSWPISVAYPGYGPLKDIIDLVISKVDEDVNFLMLKDIDDNLKRLMKSHLVSGKDFLKDATLTKDKSNYIKYLDDARRAFINASNISIKPEDCEAMECTANCYDMLKETNIANEWYKKAYNTLINYNAGFLVEYRELGENKWQDWLPPQFSSGILDTMQKKTLDAILNIFKCEKQMVHLDSVLNLRKIAHKPIGEIPLLFKVTERKIDITKEPYVGSRVTGRFFHLNILDITGKFSRKFTIRKHLDFGQGRVFIAKK